MNMKQAPRWQNYVIVFQSVALVLALCFLFYLLWLNTWLRFEVEGLAQYLGATSALSDFRQGKLRLFRINGERSRDEYSGTNDGPFEVWYRAYSRSPYASRIVTEQMVETYNMKMRYMHAHPEQFLGGTNAVGKSTASPPKREAAP